MEVAWLDAISAGCDEATSSWDASFRFRFEDDLRVGVFFDFRFRFFALAGSEDSMFRRASSAAGRKVSPPVYRANM